MVPAVILSLAAAVILVMIFCLTAQGVSETTTVADKAEKLLCSLIPPDATSVEGMTTWAGLYIRQLAHVAEFAALGLVVGLAVPCFTRKASLRTWTIAMGICALASLLDQLHKLFVPARHFDGFDLFLDFTGYVAAITVAHLIHAICARPRRFGAGVRLATFTDDRS